MVPTTRKLTAPPTPQQSWIKTIKDTPINNNSLTPSGTYNHQYCFGQWRVAYLAPGYYLNQEAFCDCDPWKQISLKCEFKYINSISKLKKKTIKCRIRDGNHFVQASEYHRSATQFFHIPLFKFCVLRWALSPDGYSLLRTAFGWSPFDDEIIDKISPMIWLKAIHVYFHVVVGNMQRWQYKEKVNGNYNLPVSHCCIEVSKFHEWKTPGI